MNFKKTLLLIAAGLSFAGEVFGAVEIKESDGAITIRNSRASLALNRSDFSLRQIRDRIRHEDYVKEPGGPLFRIAFWDPKHPGKELNIPNWFNTTVDIVADAQKATSFEYSQEIKDGKAVLTLKYRGIPLRTQTGLVDVTVTVSLADGSGLFEWGLSISNATSLQLYEVHFPILQGLASGIPGSETKDYVAVSSYCGGEKKPLPRSAGEIGQGGGEYPGIGVQLLSYCDGLGGALYFASHDPAAYRKTFIYQPCASKKAFQWYVIHYADQPGVGAWKLPYSIFCGPIQGDWYDAAKLYKRMFADKAWKSLSERTDVAPWFRDLSVWFQGYAFNGEKIGNGDPKDRMKGFSDKMVKLRDMLGEDYGFHWYLWQKYARHDYRYPDYLPASPGFKEAVEKLEKAGVHAMPYVNIRQFETSLPMWRDEHAENFAIRNIKGELDTSTTIQGVEHFADRDEKKLMGNMCFGTSYWLNKIVDIERQVLGDYGVSALYLDELAGYPSHCYATNHEHPCHGGTYYAAGENKILRDIRALKEWGGKPPVIVGENTSEAFINYCDGLLNAHSDMRPDSLPIFHTVHSNHTTEIGTLVVGTESHDPDIFLSKLGFNLVRGRQLGWLNIYFEMITPEFNKQLVKLREFCNVRRAGQEFLFFGELLRTPALASLPKVERRWVVGPSFEKVSYALPVVLGECYRAPNGDIGLILVNHTDQTHTAKIPWNTKDWGIAVGTKISRQDYGNGQWSPPISQAMTGNLTVTVPAYTPMIVKIIPEK